MCTKVYEEWTCGHIGTRIVQKWTCKHRDEAKQYMGDNGVSEQHTTVQLYLLRCKEKMEKRYRYEDIECQSCLAAMSRRRL